MDGGEGGTERDETIVTEQIQEDISAQQENDLMVVLSTAPQLNLHPIENTTTPAKCYKETLETVRDRRGEVDRGGEYL